ncbi:MAG TPA: hypothetical protein VH497_13955 [Vicinamibacterales bacterium]
MSWKMLVAVCIVVSGCSGPPGPQGPQGAAGPAGAAGSARAYARWALGTGLVASQTLNFTAVSSPSPGVYCLTPAAGIDPAKTVAFAEYGADGVMTSNVSRMAFATIDYGHHNCTAAQFQVITGVQNAAGTLTIQQMNGFTIMVP